MTTPAPEPTGGTRTACGHLRRPAATLLRPRPVERRTLSSRSASSGLPVPRVTARGRQGMLLLPGLTPTHSYMKMLYKPLRRLPLRRSPGDQQAARQARSRVRIARHRHLRRRPLLRRVRRVRQGRAEGHPRQDQRGQSRARPGAPARPAHPLVPQHLELERRAETPRPALYRPDPGLDGREQRQSSPSARAWAATPSPAKAGRTCSSPRTTPT